MADLRAIVEDGYDLIAASLPDIELKTASSNLVLETKRAALRFQVWENPVLVAGAAGMGIRAGASTSVRHRDDHIAYGVVEGDNERHVYEPPLGNIVCEVERTVV